MRLALVLPLLFLLLATLLSDEVLAQSDSAMTRLKPLGAPSAVDQFRRDRPSYDGSHRPRVATQPSNTAQTRQSAWRVESTSQAPRTNPVRQTVWMQSDFEAPPLGGGGMSLPSDAGAAPPAMPPNSSLPDSVPYPQASQPPGQPPAPGSSQPPSASPPPRALPSPQSNPPRMPPADTTPMAAPRLESSDYARIDNCNLVTGPSPYMSASVFGSGCGQVVPTTYTAVGCTPAVTAPPPMYLPPEIPSAATVPPVSVLPPLSQAVTAAPARALISFGQERNVVQVGQGLWGQPVAYVPDQHLRNWLRYFSP